MLFQQAVQEKFRQATENIDDLNKWLEKVEREIASQSIPHEDADGLKNQINALKVRSKDQTGLVSLLRQNYWQSNILAMVSLIVSDHGMDTNL